MCSFLITSDGDNKPSLLRSQQKAAKHAVKTVFTEAHKEINRPNSWPVYFDDWS